jgi:hypothetical protein
MDKYPILRNKVDALKASINQTSFWDNVLARPAPGQPGKVEIAYGHHRLTAVRELEIKEVDLIVKDLDDSTMLKIMANENLDDWKMSVSVVNETVSAAKDFIEKTVKLAKSGQVRKNSELDSFCSLYSEKELNLINNGHISASNIVRFLGTNWQEHVISQALSVINGAKEKVIDREAVEVFQEQRHAKVFTEEVRNKKIPFEKQKEFAAKIVDKIANDRTGHRTKNTSDFSGADIREASYQVKVEDNKRKHPERFEKHPIQKKMEFVELNQAFLDTAESIETIGKLIREVPAEYRERYTNKITNLIEKLIKIRSKNNG